MTRASTMECHTSRWKLLGLLGLTCLMVGLCYFCTTLPDPEPRIFGWIGVGLFGLGFIAFPVAMFRTGPQIVINDDGIDVRRSRSIFIRWDEIDSISICQVKSSRFLGIELKQPDEFVARLSSWGQAQAKLNRAMGFPSLTVSFSGLTPGLDEVWAKLPTLMEQAKIGQPQVRLN